MKDVTLNQKEQARLHVLNSVLEYQVPITQAAELLGVSPRQAPRLLAAYREQGGAVVALANFDFPLLDDLGYLPQGAEESEVLFTLIAERYERRSLGITLNLVFSEWERIFANPMCHRRGD